MDHSRTAIRRHLHPLFLLLWFTAVGLAMCNDLYSEGEKEAVSYDLP